MMYIVEIGSQAALDKFISNPMLSLVFFWSDSNDLCRGAIRIVDELVYESKGDMIAASVNVDEVKELAQRYNISSVPAFLFFKHGNLVDKAIGPRPKQFLREMIDRGQ